MRLAVSVVRADDLIAGDMIFTENFPIHTLDHKPRRLMLGGESLPNFQGGNFSTIHDTEKVGDDVTVTFVDGWEFTTSEGNEFLFLGSR